MNFKEELIKSVETDNYENELQEAFQSKTKKLFESSVIFTLDALKKEILQKSQSGNYQSINSKRHITGNYCVSYLGGARGTIEVKLSEAQFRYLWSVVGYLNEEGIKQRYLKKYSDARIYILKDGIRVGLNFINYTQKNSFLSGRYLVFNLTKIAEEFLINLKEKAYADNIVVDFAYIESGKLKISNGGNNKGELLASSPSTKGELYIKYSITF